MGRSRLLSWRFPWPRLSMATIPILLCGALVVGTPGRALAQSGDTHLVFSEVVADLDGTDRAREYFEIANLGTREWDPRDHWIYRWAYDPSATGEDPNHRDFSTNNQVMLRISGAGAANLKPIPPGGVLLVEWGRPNADEDRPAAEGPNVFATGRPADVPIQNNDLQTQMVLALFAPQADAPTFPNEAADFGGARLLAYYAQGGVDETQGVDANLGATVGMKRAAELGLWELGKTAPAGYDWATTLRWPSPAPGQATPASIGRRASDYYQTHYGLPSLANVDRARSDASVVNPRLGTPGAANLQFPGELIPGQTLANGNSLLLQQVAATPATTVAGSPATAVHIAATNTGGAIAANLLTSPNWSGWRYIGGPSVGKPIIVDNPKTGGRAVFAVDAITGGLFVNRYAAAGSQPAAFQGWQQIAERVTGTPVVSIDTATGNETVVYNDPQGLTMVLSSSQGVFSAAEPLPGDPKLTDLAVEYTPLGLVVLGYEGVQLRMSVVIQGAFTDLDNVGPPVPNRTPIAPVIRYNRVAGQIEILTSGENGALLLTRVKASTTPTTSAPITVGISTDTNPGMAVNPDTGDLMVIARGADRPVPEGERVNPAAGQALTAVFRNTSGKFDPPTRVGSGLMPPGASPDVIYNRNTQQYEQFLVGEDLQVYRNTVAP